MNVLLISSNDILGGAARATYRLHKGLQSIGVNSQILVQEKFSDDKSVIAPKLRLSQGIAKATQTIDAMPLKFYNQRSNTLFSLQWLPDRVLSRVKNIAPDVINLHWINGGFVQIETLAKFNCPIVWTLHDMWAFTGGCHYSGDCIKYHQSCGSCPQLQNTQSWDLSNLNWQRKAKAWKNLDMTILSPSKWLAKCLQSSSLFRNHRVEVIPNGIDTRIYQPVDKSFARKLLKLPQDKKLVLFGALFASTDERKGFRYLKQALQYLKQVDSSEKIELVIFGNEPVDNSSNLGFQTHYLGTFNDDLSLAIVYSAADIFVAPSTQDNLPNTVMESLACGTPCVAFDIGGMPDMIEHEKNGYLAKAYSVEDLSHGIAWVLENIERYKKLSFYAREKVEQEFSSEIQANRYLSIYEKAIEDAFLSKNRVAQQFKY